MSTKVKSILFFVFLCLYFVVSVEYQLERKEQREKKEQEIKIENEIVKREEVKEETKVEIKEEPIVEEPQLVNLGQFKLTAYCACSKCCGKWSGGNTASGTKPTANRTIAVDTSVIPFGTEVIINGVTYIAEDTGSAINGNKIDIYMESHQAALQFGVQYAEVFIKK